jgi:hypothetical protein
VEVGNSCARTLSSVPLLLLPFYSPFVACLCFFLKYAGELHIFVLRRMKATLPPFLCFKIFIAFSSFSVWFFIALPFPPFFNFVFRLLWVSSLAYLNLLGTKRLGCCCCCMVLLTCLGLSSLLLLLLLNDFLH